MKTDFSFYLNLSTISTVAVLIPLFVGLYRRKYFDSAEKILLYLMILSLLTEIVVYIFVKRNINNMYVFHIYTVIEFVFISLFYIKAISLPRFTLFLRILALLFIGVAIFDFLHERNAMDDISTTTESLLVIVYSVVGFYSLLKNPVQARVFAIPLFWLNTAILLYFAGNFFLFIFSNYIEQHSHKVYYELWGIHSVMNILFYVLISIGFWKTKTR